VIGLLILNIIPMIATIYQSFYKTGDFGRGNIFIGFKNFQKLFADEAVLQSIINTFKYTIAQVPEQISKCRAICMNIHRFMYIHACQVVCR
jgi:multiple sugar transport system permease protein